jgi:hypothetical protein
MESKGLKNGKQEKILWITLVSIGILLFIFVIILPGIHSHPAPAKKLSA